MDRAKSSRTVITSLSSSSSSSTFSNSSSLSNSSTSITLPARHKKMEGRGKCSEEDLVAKEEELPDDDRSLSRKSSQSSFIESRKSSVTNMGGGREERGNSETSCDLASVGRELESWSQGESKEPPTDGETEEHLLVSCTASSYFTPTEGLDRDKQSEEKR